MYAMHHIGQQGFDINREVSSGFAVDSGDKKLIIYDDRSNSTNPDQGQNGRWVGWDNPAFNVTAHDKFSNNNILT